MSNILYFSFVEKNAICRPTLQILQNIEYVSQSNYKMQFINDKQLHVVI